MASKLHLNEPPTLRKVKISGLAVGSPRSNNTFERDLSTRCTLPFPRPSSARVNTFSPVSTYQSSAISAPNTFPHRTSPTSSSPNVASYVVTDSMFQSALSCYLYLARTRALQRRSFNAADDDSAVRVRNGEFGGKGTLVGRSWRCPMAQTPHIGCDRRYLVGGKLRATHRRHWYRCKCGHAGVAKLPTTVRSPALQRSIRKQSASVLRSGADRHGVRNSQDVQQRGSASRSSISQLAPCVISPAFHSAVD